MNENASKIKQHIVSIRKMEDWMRIISWLAVLECLGIIALIFLFRAHIFPSTDSILHPSIAALCLLGFYFVVICGMLIARKIISVTIYLFEELRLVV